MKNTMERIGNSKFTPLPNKTLIHIVGGKRTDGFTISVVTLEQRMGPNNRMQHIDSIKTCTSDDDDGKGNICYYGTSTCVTDWEDY